MHNPIRLRTIPILFALLPVVISTGQTLPTDPGLLAGELENGLNYAVLEHDNPPGRVMLWMYVSTGSINETDEQRGLAHFLEHLAFNGSEHFEKNDVIGFFEAMGLTFGQHQNAMTSFDQTRFILELPNNKPETLDQGLLFFADVAGRLSLDPLAIDNEREVILEELRSRLSPEQRVQEYIFERISPGSRFGERLPIGTEESIKTIDRDDFLDYYHHWYVPSNITLVVVGDIDPESVVPAIERQFSFGPRVPRPVDADPQVEPYQTTQAIVATDAELKQASVSIVRIDEPAPPTTTEALMREREVEDLAVAAFNRRLARKISEGQVSFLSGSAFLGNLFNSFRFIAVGAEGDPQRWRDMLAELAVEMQRARLHGFTERELDDVRKQLIAGLERAVEREETQPSQAIVAQVTEAVADEEPYLSAAQRLEIMQRLLPAITPEEISTRFRELYDPAAVTFIVELPIDATVPTEAELVSLGQESLAVTPDAEGESARPSELMAVLPEPGTVVDQTEHDRSAVTSAWLSNGVRLNYRFMDYRKDQATITINLAGGSIEETPENHGITAAASLAWSRPATSRLSSSDIRDLMVGTKVSVAGGADLDALTMLVSGKPAELETGMQLAYLLLTDPLIEEAALSQWQEQERQAIEARKLQPGGVVAEAFTAMISPPGEVRLLPMELQEMDRITREKAQAWLERIIREAPIEVSVVGDLPWEQARDLVCRYLGSLPPRERISSQTNAALRRLDRPVGPLVESLEIETQTPMAIVQSGFFGPDWTEVEDRRLLNLATQILSTRMIKELREQEQLVYSIGARSAPNPTYPGYSMVMAGAPTDPGKASALQQRIAGMYQQFAEQGATDEEIEIAKKQIDNQLDEQMKDPRFWNFFLGNLTYRGTNLDDLVAAREAYAAFTGPQVLDAFRRYYRDDASFSIVVRPKTEGAGS